MAWAFFTAALLSASGACPAWEATAAVKLLVCLCRLAVFAFGGFWLVSLAALWLRQRDALSRSLSLVLFCLIFFVVGVCVCTGNPL